MAAPDLPPPPPYEITERPLFVHLHPRLVDPASLAGGVVVMIDQLRASVTMTAALASGAEAIVPAFTADDARATAAKLKAAGVRTLLGGERGGVRIEGFDLDNSPLAYTRERVAGARIVFTTTNGTAAILLAREAAEIYIGSLANLSALCAHLAREPRPVHILCAGTREEVTLDDVIPAGAMVERLIAAGRQMGPDDQPRVALEAWRSVAGTPGGILRAFLESRGGRSLARMGLADDVAFCARLDTLRALPAREADGSFRDRAPKR